MKILVTGGAGYIGSHTVAELHTAGMEPVVVDNFSNSQREVLGRLEQIAGRPVECHEADMTDRAAIRAIFEQVKPEAVVHFAALKVAPDSVADPLKYYHNNLLGQLTLCEVMAEFGVKRIVFSSSAAVYGDGVQMPVVEDSSLAPANPYGQTKAMGEQVLRDLAASDPDWSVTILRYFNPVGAHESGIIGEEPHGVPASLVPRIARVAAGKLDRLTVFGDDYDTVDGTGVRDYIHVVDLAQAHVRALEYQKRHQGLAVFNVGTGQGYSVLETVKAFEAATGQRVAYQIAPRRAGDPAVSYADTSRAERELGWKAKKTLADMCADAWRWQSRNL
jgi:UDP-glucose 4-epimerase